MEASEVLKYSWRLASYLDMSNQNNCNRIVSTTTKRIYNEIRKHRYNYTKTIICLRLSENC